MGQQIRNSLSKGNILGIWGVPGNGKTTLIKEGIAKAMNKPFIFISLGGASDASFLEGHSYTYEGSIFGRIAKGIIDSKCMNPIFYFDELDKISTTHKGEEITNMLVHLTDPVQNNAFVDKYFHGLEFDLSRATFIFSFNNPRNVNHILLDRITTVKTQYLLLSQKIHIAKNYLLPRILKEVGLKENSVKIKDDLILHLIDKYTCEGGVRKLKSILFSIIREINIANLTKSKINRKTVSFPFTVNKNHLTIFLKELDEITSDKIHLQDKIGIVNGLWANSIGIGGVLPIEISMIPGKSLLEIKATGSLEKVIKESIEVACTLAWSKLHLSQKNLWLDKWSKQPETFHIHCPTGSVPKDGPSAGAALTLGIYSLLTFTKIKHNIAMTGEINLQGEVLPIGGLEIKLESAKKADVKLVLIPKKNEKNLFKILERNNELLNNNFEVKIVENIDQVFEYSLVKIQS